MEVPWTAITPLGICLAVCGTLGLVYSIATIWHAHKATYNPDLEDWIWYTALPVLAHLGLLIAACLLWSDPPSSLFVLAVDALLFLLLGIHNSWDTVTYIVVQHDEH